MSVIRPSPEVAPLVALIGDAATLALLDAYAGIRIQVPVRARADSSLARAIGPAAAAKLVAEFGGGKLQVPLAKRWRIQHYRLQGMSYAAIARRVGANERMVHQVLHDHGMTGQLALQL